MAGPAPSPAAARGLTWAIFDGQPVDALITTRHGGVSDGPYASLNLGLHVGDEPDRVLVNRRRAAAAVGLDRSDLVFATQAHGRGVAVVDTVHRGRGSLALEDAVADVDALVTATPGLGLVAMVADCVPLVLYEPVAHVVACVHAGWRGTVARVVDAAVLAMGSLGARPDRVLAGIGPAVAPDRYQVGGEVAEAVRACFGRAAPDLIWSDGTGRWHLDLVAANHRTLIEAGVPEASIETCGVATGEGSPFFSDRAARPCGRFAAIAALRP
jgi:YfiH family protein